jgi:hypothetical protein
MSPSFVDKVGTEAEERNDKYTIKSISNSVPDAFDAEKIVNLHYVYFGSANALSGQNGIAFSTNSVYDPDIDNVSGNFQPTGRDFWASLYNYYKVINTKIYFQLGCNAKMGNADSMNLGSDGLPLLVGGMMDISAQEPLTLNSWLNAAEIKSGTNQQIFSPISTVAIDPTAQTSYTMNWSPGLFDGAVLNQTIIDTWTPVGANPDGLEYFIAIIHNPGANSKNYWYRIHIEYTVAFKQVNRTILNTIN